MKKQCSTWEPSLPGGEVEPIMVGVTGSKRAVTVLRRSNKLTASYHIRLRLKKKRTKEELVTPPRDNPWRSKTPLPTQEAAFEAFNSQAGTIVTSVRRRRRRHRKIVKDHNGAVDQYHRLASDLRNRVATERTRRASLDVPAAWRIRYRPNYDGIDEFLFDATITLRMKVVFRRSYRKIPLVGLVRMFFDFENIGSGVVRKSIDSQCKHELYDEHHFVFPSGDLADPPVVETAGVRRDRANAPY
jgi:hypothetical protein